MAFFSAAGIDRLYSGVTKTYPSNSAILLLHSCVWAWA
jgi:hypothetical protein